MSPVSLSLSKASSRAWACTAAMLFSASLAHAQSYLVDGPNPVVFSPLPVTATKLTVPSFSGATVGLPFTFSFFGQPVTTVGVSIYGYLVLADGSAGESTNTDIPQVVMGSIPSTFIAPWWDELTEGGTYRWLVSGVAPLRNAAFEWASSGGTFQVQLFESTGQIRFTYGPTPPTNSFSASVGIQRQLATGVAGLSCTPGCSGGDWASLANRAVDFYTPSDLRVTRTSVDESGYAGVAYRASATVRNSGGHLATNVPVRFYLSTDADFSSATDAPLGDAVIASLPALSEETVTTSTLTVPAGTMPSGYFIIAVVDPANSIVETDETNNVGSPAAMTVRPPKGDLVVAAMVPPVSATPGAMLSIARTFRNAGNASMGAFRYTWLLSDNSAVSVSDRALLVGQVAGVLAAGQNDVATDTVALPADVAPGRYWLGLCLNFDAAATSVGFGSDEISYLNNCFTPTQSTVISTGAVTVLTASLPTAISLGVYGAHLQATGGTGEYTWALTSGALPPGLTLSDRGELSGVPAVNGSYAFEVQATSGASMSAVTRLTLEVMKGDLALGVVDQVLPSASFGRPYRAGLIAVGGRPPYAWSSTGLPSGLAMSTAGSLEGRATELGDHSFLVTVTDSAAATVERTVRIRVVSPPSLAIATVALPNAVLHRDFVQELKAVGGTGSYQWALTRFQQLPETPTDVRGPVLTDFPPKFGLSVSNGERGVLRGTPALAGLFSLTLQATDAAGTKESATMLLLVTSLEGLALTTTELPDAFVNQVYTVKLGHNGGREAQVTFSTPCLQEAKRPDEPSTCAPREPSQSLPNGLTLMSDGTLSGRPIAELGTYRFWVRVADASGRQDTRGYSIRVQPDFSKSQGGCSTSGGLGSIWAILALISLGVGRRRRWGLALGVSLSLVSLSGCGSSKNLCTAVTCDEPLSCDPADGVCKCGGRGGVVCSQGFACGLSTTCEPTRKIDCTAKPGTSADVFDGLCKCGGTGGQVCGPGESCNPNAKTCVAARNCMVVACGVNEVCESLTGRCLCSGTSSCNAGQTCAIADGGVRLCIADACSGVTCTGGNRCDPVDGACKCNSARCLSGEACACPSGSADGGCAFEARACRVGSACAGVSCVSPATCDPVSGQCTCGGPGGPVCGGAQVCALEPQLQCQGGEQCLSPDGGAKQCASGSSCDPEDGRCKCGGLGGAECAGAEVCIRNASSQACRAPCDVRNPVCPNGMYCYYDSSAATPAAYCAAATDSKAEDSACTQATACFAMSPARSLHCAGLVVGQTGICRAYCDLAGGNSACVQAPRAHTCVQISGAPVGFGMCLPR